MQLRVQRPSPSASTRAFQSPPDSISCMSKEVKSHCILCDDWFAQWELSKVCVGHFGDDFLLTLPPSPTSQRRVMDSTKPPHGTKVEIIEGSDEEREITLTPLKKWDTLVCGRCAVQRTSEANKWEILSGSKVPMLRREVITIGKRKKQRQMVIEHVVKDGKGKVVLEWEWIPLTFIPLDLGWSHHYRLIEGASLL